MFLNTVLKSDVSIMLTWVFFSLPFGLQLIRHPQVKKKCFCTAYQDTLESHPSVHLRASGLNGGCGGRVREMAGGFMVAEAVMAEKAVAGVAVKQWDFSGGGGGGRGNEWEPAWPCVLQLERPVALSEERPH